MKHLYFCFLHSAHSLMLYPQGLTKVPSGCPGQVVFEAGQVTFHGHLPDGQVPGQNNDK